MNKLFLLLFFILSLIVSCSSCAKKNEQVDGSVPPSPPIVQPTAIARDNWQVVLPSGWIEKTTALPGIVLLAHSADQKQLLFLQKVPVSGGSQELVALYVRDIHDEGAKLISTNQVEINGTKYVLLEAAKPTTKAWVWITTVNNYGYSLICAGAASDIDTCSSIASSLVLR